MKSRKIKILLVALATVGIAYCADTPKNNAPQTENIIFEGTQLPSTQKSNITDKKLVGSDKSVLPPKYLSVPDFKKCLSTIKKDNYSSWCLPEKKPDECPQNSWDILIGIDQHIPYCTMQSAQSHITQNIEKVSPDGGFLLAVGDSDIHVNHQYEVANLYLRDNCNLQGNVGSGNYSFNMSNNKCVTSAMFLMLGDFYQKDDLKDKKAAQFTFSRKDGVFYINGHSVSNNNTITNKENKS